MSTKKNLIKLHALLTKMQHQAGRLAILCEDGAEKLPGYVEKFEDTAIYLLDTMDAATPLLEKLKL